MAGNAMRCLLCGYEMKFVKSCRQKCKKCGYEIDCEDGGFDE